MDAIEFKIRLKRANLTRSEAAEKLGVKVDTINAYCKVGKSAREIPAELVQKIDSWPQFVAEPDQNGTKDVPIEKAVPSLVPAANDWETGYVPITEEYAKSLGYGSGVNWFETARRAILSARKLGETRGKIAGHERWEPKTVKEVG